MTSERDMLVLARKLRAKAMWDYTDDYYSTDVDTARNAAKREAFEDFADLLDETFDFDSKMGIPQSREWDYTSSITNIEKWIKTGASK